MSHRIPPSMDEANALLPLEAPRWYILRIIGGKERKAVKALQEILTRRGLVAYMPAETKVCRQRGGRTERRLPLVPGYVFAQATSDLFHVLRAVDGVTGFLTRQTAEGPQPYIAPADFILGLAFAEVFGMFDQTRGAKPSYKVSQPIKVAVGRYADWPGKVLGTSGDGRVRVLLAGIGGRETERTFDPGELKAA